MIAINDNSCDHLCGDYRYECMCMYLYKYICKVVVRGRDSGGQLGTAAGDLHERYT